MTSCQPLRPHGSQFCRGAAIKDGMSMQSYLFFCIPQNVTPPFHYFKGGVIIPFEK